PSIWCGSKAVAGSAMSTTGRHISRKILDRPIAFHRCFVTVAGSVSAALMLSQAIYWCQRTGRGSGWFYKSHLQWEDETGLTRHQQVTARKLLRASGVWFEERRGIPARLWFDVDLDALISKLENLDVKQAVRKPHNRATESNTSSSSNSVQHLILSESTSENTSGAAPNRSSQDTKSDARSIGETERRDIGDIHDPYRGNVFKLPKRPTDPLRADLHGGIFWKRIE